MNTRTNSACLIVVLGLFGLAVGGAVLSGRPPATEKICGEMSAAASAWLKSLSPELAAKAVLPFDGKDRTDWHFVPRTRPGVTFGEMNDAQRIAARALLRSTLSSQGVLKVESIMALDGVLREMENNNPGRDPLAYTVTLYGSPSTPGQREPWGWKIEGHHVCLNFTVVGSSLSVTPEFLGANPAEVRSGPWAGRRALALEEDLGRELVVSLSPEQKTQAVILKEVPADILTAPGRPVQGIWPEPPIGLPVSAMTAAQKDLVVRLLQEYARNLRPELAEPELARMNVDQVRFCWAGPVEPGKGHYYRLVGTAFVIEYDNTQNNANHVHTVWHDRTRDFGNDALKDHYRQGGHDPKPDQK